jgi:hypothetical protein
LNQRLIFWRLPYDNNVTFSKIEIRLLQDVIGRIEVCQFAPDLHILFWEIKAFSCLSMDLEGRPEKRSLYGAFRFVLPPGHYSLEPESSAFLSAGSLEFGVEPGVFTSLTVLYHTNIQ